MAEANVRPTRAEEVRQERRRKPGSTVMSGIKLGVDESKLDRKNYEYRWVNDRGNRVQQLTSNDWDLAPEQAALAAGGEGTVQSTIVGTDGGKPYSGILMRKRKDWFEADRAEKLKPVHEVEQAIRAGTNHQKDSPELRDGTYTPNGANTLDR
jgi:hypothetical protein